MGLRDVEKKLFSKDEEDGKNSIGSFWGKDREKTAEENPFRPEELLSPGNDRSAIWIKEDEEKKKKKQKLKKFFLIAASATLGLLVLYWAVNFIRKEVFSEEKVKVSVSSEEKVQSGDLATFIIAYQNLNA